jgi:protein-disulfide isomerase
LSNPSEGRSVLGGQSRLALLAVVVVVAIVVAAGLFLQGRASPSTPPAASAAAPGSTTAAGILVPTVGTPTNIAFERTLGRPDAPVRLTVWSDFQCVPCRDFAQNSLPRLIRDFVVPGTLRVEFRDLAVMGLESPAAAAAARCADDQDKFWPYHDVLFANQIPEESGLLGPQRLKDMADAIGLDRTRFDACLPSGTVFNDVQTETGRGKARGDSVPILDLGGLVLEGSPPYDQLSQTVEQLIASAPTAGPPAPSGSAAPSGGSAAPSGSTGPSASP